MTIIEFNSSLTLFANFLLRIYGFMITQQLLQELRKLVIIM